MSNHDFLVKCFPMTAQDRAEMRERLNRDDEAVGVSLDDFSELQNAIGEDIDEAIEDVRDDQAEPSEAQKRDYSKFTGIWATHLHESEVVRLSTPERNDI